MASQGKGALVGTLLVLGLIGYACGKDDGGQSSSSSATQLTVRSAETFADLTLSDGRKVHNTLVDNVASMVIPYSGASASYQAQLSCITQAMNKFATDNLVGRPVSRVDQSMTSYSSVTPIPGYAPASLYFVDGSSTYSDVSTVFGQVRATAESSCYSPPSTTTETPVPTSEAPVTEEADPDVYVNPPDVDAPKRHTGHSGHPCGPGERDGDHDGYCGEGR